MCCRECVYPNEHEVVLIFWQSGLDLGIKNVVRIDFIESKKETKFLLMQLILR